MALSLLEGNLAICSASHKAATLDVYKSKTSNLRVWLEEKTNVPMWIFNQSLQGLLW